MSLLKMNPPEAAFGLPASDPDLVAFLRRPETCLSAMVDATLSAYGDREALAWRPFRGGVLAADYVAISYPELRHRVHAVAATLAHDPALHMVPGQPVAIMAFANVDFVALNLALGLAGMVIAPLQTSATLEALTGLVTELEAPCIAGSVEHLDAVLTLACASPATRCVLVFDYNGLDAAGEAALNAARQRLAADKPGCTLLTFIAADQDRELQELRQTGRNAPVLDTICRAAGAVLGGERVTADSNASFAGLGGDSLAALSYALLLEDIYGFAVDVGTIMHPTGSFGTLAAEIERTLAGEGHDLFAHVHGTQAGVLRAADLTVDKLIATSVFCAARQLTPPVDIEPATVLLTGANGFLGRFICLECLKRLERTGGRLICVGRGSDDDSARQRLLSVFAGGDGPFERDLMRLEQGGRLSVIAGDLAAPRLGLMEQAWARLAADVDLIVHPAALVNHKLPYRQLFGPNVVGTATLIELALTTRMKRIVHVSTVAAAAHGKNLADEDDDIRDAIPEWNTSEAYADGYAASKWAAETLLADAHARFGLPVSVFRSNMILAPIAYSGQLNIPDLFTRQILSLALTRIAPESFYTGEGAQAHYEGLPVDFIAAAMVAIGEARRTGFHTFHVLNPHDDGISMDSFVDWLGELGYEGSRIASFEEWRTRFEGALRALPEEQRHASLLPLMDAFSRPQPAQAGSAMSAARFVEAVAEARVTPVGRIPHLGPALIERYVEDLKAAGLL